ncbi:hypothetical protein ECC02_000765 [Trypanosoma cruzi]|uniref:Uncharacterized protein n=1 Tax=Trypanosoma cruzi TaxID=5693 RepID=A0A7J6YI01_TRYCR|nr:hypothetical protein ECC02_000765 [Trypanosoma cruzi]
MTTETDNFLHATPSSAKSYPTYTPPPPLPSRNSVRTSSTATRRTFHDECDEVIRLIREDTLAASPSERAIGGVCVSRVSAHEKYRAILDEVEHLNRLLEVTVEERVDVQGELQGKLTQMEISLRARERELRQRDEELLHLRGAVEAMRTQLEALHRTRQTETQTTRAASGSDSLRDAVVHRDGGDGVPSAATDAATRKETSTKTTKYIAQRSLRWLKFLVKRCFFFDEGANGKLTQLMNLLNDLEEYSVEPRQEAHAVRSLCTQVSNRLVDLVLRGANEWRLLDRDVSDLQTSTERHFSHDQEDFLRRRVAELKVERDTLKQEAVAIAEENLQLMSELKSREIAAPRTPSPAARVEQLEAQNAILLAERNRQAVHIDELEQKVRALEDEKNAMHLNLVQQRELLKRHERVLHFISRHEWGERSDSSGGEGSGSGRVHTTVAK